MDDQPIHTITASGDQKWCLPNGKLHREDGPAYISNAGSKWWYFNGELHREDGPAVEYLNGYKSWWIHDKLIHVDTQEEFEKLMRLRAFW
jgi:hypothetical protein